ncbi:MAG: DUF4160 domain-containing protein [Chitinivibrionia bacterium]|jgi:hypothetical protein|nr:DUF4160 domain-containing protein [Chitinivibrionia bacterium]
MPTISRFFGIIIKMEYNEHNPPHFHAEYNGERAAFDFEGNIISGNLPLKQIRAVQVWTDIHVDELAANWEISRAQGELIYILPLR